MTIGHLRGQLVEYPGDDPGAPALRTQCSSVELIPQLYHHAESVREMATYRHMIQHDGSGVPRAQTGNLFLAKELLCQLELAPLTP